jgi:F0F1-type ATP synthase delta subunit
MSDIAEANTLDLTSDDHRATLRTQLKLLKARGSVVHMTFAEEPTPEVMVKMVAWIRSNLHPAALVQTGLQPGIVAGCIVRTPSHIYDFSISSVLKSKKPILKKLISGRSTVTPDPVPEPKTPEQVHAETIQQGGL